MKALTFHGKRDVRVDNVPDPAIEEPTDAVIRVTSTAICGSDLHLYEVLGPFIGEGDILGHEPMGIVEEGGDEVKHIKAGDRVVIPFNISCGDCYMCNEGLFAQCETTQVHEQRERAARHDVQTINAEEHDDVPAMIREMTGGRGPDSVIDAVGMEAHGAPLGKIAQTAAGLLPDVIAEKAIEKFGVDRMEV